MTMILQLFSFFDKNSVECVAYYVPETVEKTFFL